MKVRISYAADISEVPRLVNDLLNTKHLNRFMVKRLQKKEASFFLLYL